MSKSHAAAHGPFAAARHAWLAAGTAYLALPRSPRYGRTVAIWFGVFCADFAVLPGEQLQRWLFYAFVPLTLPAVVATARRLWVSPLARVMAAFLTWSAVSALWSDNPLSVGDATRRSAWVAYLLVLCCFVGLPGPDRWRRVLHATQVFAALAAVVSIVEFRWTCVECARFTGFGHRANANYTASVAGAIGLLGLAAVLSAPARRALPLLACQIPMAGLLVATGSRAAMLAYLSGVVLAVALVAARRERAPARRVLQAASGAVAVMAALAMWFGRGWLEAEIDRGDPFRRLIWAETLGRIADRPWFGYGSTTPDLFVSGGRVMGYHAHNLFLAQAFYGGLPQAVLLAVALGLAGAAARRAWLASGDVLPIVGLWFLIAVGMIDMGPLVVEVQAIWLYAWIVLGIVLSYDVLARERSATSSP